MRSMSVSLTYNVEKISAGIVEQLKNGSNVSKFDISSAIRQVKFVRVLYQKAIYNCWVSPF